MPEFEKCRDPLCLQRPHAHPVGLKSLQKATDDAVREWWHQTARLGMTATEVATTLKSVLWKNGLHITKAD